MCRPKASVNPPTFPVMCCQRSSLRLCLYMTVQSLPVWDWRNLIQPDTLVRLCQVCFFSFFFPVSMLLRNVCKKPFSHHSLYVPYLALKRRLLIWFSWHVLTRYFASKAQALFVINCHVCVTLQRYLIDMYACASTAELLLLKQSSGRKAWRLSIITQPIITFKRGHLSIPTFI